MPRSKGHHRQGSIWLPETGVCFAVSDDPDHLATAATRRNASGGSESGQTATNMAPQRKVINQGETKTQRALHSESGTPGRARIQITPSASIFTSRLRPDDGRALDSAQPEAAAETSAALHTRTG